MGSESKDGGKPLTNAAVKAAKGPTVRTEKDLKRSKWYPDEGTRGLSGFGVRVYGTGGKVYALRYRNTKGKQRTFRIGDVGDFESVEDARNVARKAKAAVLEGQDPQETRKEARERDDSKLSTVGELAERWLEDFATVHRRSAKMDAYRVRRIVEDLGRASLDGFAVSRLAAWHSAGKDSPVEANRTLETLRAAWRWAERLKLLPPGAPDSSMFKGGRDATVRRFPETSRDRWLRPEEVSRLMDAVGTEEDPFFKAAVPLLLLTGLRKRELLRAKWADVDLERGEIRLPQTKSGKAQTRKLSRPAVAILKELPRLAGSPFVFPRVRDPNRPRDDIKEPWLRVRKAAGIEDVTLHDLRRTAGSFMAQHGVPVHTIGEVLGHSDPSVTKIYTRLAEDNERQAVEALGETLNGILKLVAAPKAEKAPTALPDRLRALLAASGDDPEALADGLRGLVDWSGAVEA